jgi:hypothetical protein
LNGCLLELEELFKLNASLILSYISSIGRIELDC